MGFGHRVYKSYDPRAKIIKRTADEVFEVTGKNPLLDIALELERIALEDEYFVTRKLYPNVDFYSGLIYQAMGFPVEMFPVLFAIPRTAGWIAQWEEMLLDPEQKIARPRQIYIGPEPRDYVPHGQAGVDRDASADADGRLPVCDCASVACCMAPSSRCSAAGQARSTFDGGARLGAPAAAQVAIGPRPSGSPALEQTRRYIMTQLDGAGITAAEQAFDAADADRQGPDGQPHRHHSRARAPSGSLIASHYDTKLFREFRFVGASDGASCTGVPARARRGC